MVLSWASGGYSAGLGGPSTPSRSPGGLALESLRMGPSSQMFGTTGLESSTCRVNMCEHVEPLSSQASVMPWI